MKLSELLKFNQIVIQCHDNPDADALASGYAMYLYFKKFNKEVSLVYGGRYKLQKSNLLLMIQRLAIPIDFVEAVEKPELLLTVDCQYGQGNVSKFDAENIAIIDHHQVVGNDLPELCEIRSNMGACSTIIADMLKDEGISINDDEKLATALYYGLLTDTNNFAEISHPLDKDLRDEAKYDRTLINLFRNSNLSLTELGIAGEALMGYCYRDKHRYAIVESKPCDPNILGMISDLTLEVDTVDACLVYSILPFGVKFSVRSCVREVNAGELAEYISDGIGGGGGHLGKAGGFIQLDLLEALDEYSSKEDIEKILDSRMEDYFAGAEIIEASQYQADITGVPLYKKKNLPIGYVVGTDIVPAGSRVFIRTLEGDMDIEIADDIYIMIGIKGEVYPCTKEKFDRAYTKLDQPYDFEGEYSPSIKDNLSGEKIEITKYARSCVASGEVQIYAKPLSGRVKIFTAWDKERYMLGKVGDYLAIRKDDLHDVYVIEKDIFNKTYQAI